MKCAMKRKLLGFTLTELLIVIAIIAVLTAILFPVFLSVRAKGRQTVCISNLRQLGMAVFQYAGDYDDHYPYGGDPSDLNTTTWQNWKNGKYWPQIQQMQHENLTIPNVMNGYVKDRGVWRCPSDTGFSRGGSFEDIPMDAHPSCFEAYGMSYLYTTPLALDDQTLSNVRAWGRSPPYSAHDPANISLFHDHVGHWHGGIERSEERLNEVMLDGHAITVNRYQADEIDHISFAIPTPTSIQ